MAALTPVFLDTSVLLSGLIDFGPESRFAQELMHAVASGRLGRCHTAWHCCLEIYAVATRLPAEYRLAPADAVHLIEEELVGRLDIHDLPADSRIALLRSAASDRLVGGRVYDAHIAETARAAGAACVVTENRRHFTGLLPHGIAVLTAGEFLERSR